MGIEILKKSYFDPEGKTTSKERVEERKSLLTKIKTLKANNSYHNFGYDYFDNEKYVGGYGGYNCDLRYETEVKNLCTEFGLVKNSKILDYGCAKGTIVKNFINLGYLNSYGLDVSNYAINQAPPELKKNLFVFSGDIKEIPFKEPFDLVISKDVLPHLSFLQLHELFDSLKRLDCKKYYFEIQTVTRSKDLKDLLLWDYTHKCCLTEDWWYDLLNNYFGSELKVYFKKIL